MNKNIEYSPVQHYNRKLVRSVLRNKIEKQYGYHDVSNKLHNYFDKYQSLIVKNN